MRHIQGAALWEIDADGFRRRIIDEGSGPIRSYAFSAGDNEDSPEHCHAESLELFLALDGEGTVVVEGVEVNMAQSDVLIVEPGEYHYVAKNGPKPLKLLAVVTPNLQDAILKETSQSIKED